MNHRAAMLWGPKTAKVLLREVSHGQGASGSRLGPPKNMRHMSNVT